MRLIKVSLLLFTVVFLITACSSFPEQTETATFYYTRANTHYNSQSVLVREVRPFQGSLEQFLKQYLSGPQDQHLQSPFPPNLKVELCSIEASQVNIVLSDHMASLTGVYLTIACCALSNTCFANYDVSTVNISAKNTLLDGQETLSFTENMLYQ